MGSGVIQGCFPGGAPRPIVRSLPLPSEKRQISGPPKPAFAGPCAAGAHSLQAKGARDSFPLDPAMVGLARGGGSPLPDRIRGRMEAALGADFSSVKVHVGPQAERIGAIAFTTGDDIYFAPGRFQPDTSAGQHLLGHELAHVVQQRQGRVRNPAGGLAVVHDRALEAEADRLGRTAAAAVQRKPAAASGPPAPRGPIGWGPCNGRSP
jgi:hypothetical protein